MRKIAVINQKGGVGKTTSTINIGSGLASLGKKVLIVDLDPQGNIGAYFNKYSERDITNLIIDKDITYNECLTRLTDNLHLITSNETLEKAVVIMTEFVNRETTLIRKLKELNKSDYDYVLLDCPPSLGLLNQNALLFANEAIIPVSTDVFGVDALKKMESAISKINDYFDHDMKITAIIPTLFDRRNNICKKTLKKISSKYADLITNPVSISSKLKESPGYRKSIFAYARNHRSAKEYMNIVHKIDFMGYN
jgi:chromosome partitioning protein